MQAVVAKIFILSQILPTASHTLRGLLVKASEPPRLRGIGMAKQRSLSGPWIPLAGVIYG